MKLGVGGCDHRHDCELAYENIAAITAFRYRVTVL
jgi:hypothetical protein